MAMIVDPPVVDYCKQAGRQADRKAGRQRTGRQAGVQADKPTGRQGRGRIEQDTKADR